MNTGCDNRITAQPRGRCIRALAAGLSVSRMGPALLLAVLLVTGVPQWIQANPDPRKEYEIKAACLYNFLKFVEWPESAFSNAASPIVIGILGPDPFGQSLAALIKGETAKGHPLAVLQSQDVRDLLGCHVIFIRATEAPRLPAIMKHLEGKTILIVGESENFARLGGIINFYIQEERVRLEINHKAARSVGINISSQLLRLSRIIEPETK